MTPTNTNLEPCSMADMQRIAQRNQIFKRRAKLLLNLLLGAFSVILAYQLYNIFGKH